MIRGVVIRRPAAAEAAQLVADLLRDDQPVRAEAAKARLLVLGARAVPHLVDALASATDAELPRLLGVVELLPATRQVLPSLDAAVARHEGACASVAAVFASWLASEDRSLATLAFDRLAALALSETAPSAARRVAARAIRGLGDQAAAELLARLPTGLATGDDASASDARQTPSSATDTAARPGRPADDSATALRQHVTTQAAVLPLSELHRALERARARQHAAASQAEAQDWLAARGAVHQALAHRGSTVALYDLRELFERLDGPPPVSAIAAIRELGDASCLEAMATAWTRLEDAWTRDQLLAAASAIGQRHALTARHLVVKRLHAKGHPLAAAVAPAGRPGRAR
jgi:hypothetical protein